MFRTRGLIFRQTAVCTVTVRYGVFYMHRCKHSSSQKSVYGTYGSLPEGEPSGSNRVEGTKLKTKILI